MKNIKSFRERSSILDLGIVLTVWYDLYIILLEIKFCCNTYTGLIDMRLLQVRIQWGAPPPPKIGKNMIFWRKIVIFHTKYPNNFRVSLRSAQFF